MNSSPNVVGSGARALGMGGAFIAVADDATAASWNPGGLTQLERPEISIVYDMNWYSESFDSETHYELNSNHDSAFSGINYFSIVYPIPRTIGGRNLVFSLNYQRQYDFDRDLKLRLNEWTGLVGGNIADIGSRLDYSQRGSLGSISPAFGFEITDKISVGLVLNIWNQSLLPDNEWKVRRVFRERVRINGMIFPFSWIEQTIDEDFKNFEGHNYTVGFLYKPTERLSLGVVYHSKFTAEVDYIRTEHTRLAAWGYQHRRRSQEITLPSAVGIGVAYRFPNDKLTVSLDITRREWDQFVILDPTNSSLSMKRRSGVSGLPKYLSPHDPTYTVRLGAEYVFVNTTKPRQDYMPSLRAGVFYDPEPASGRSDEWFGLAKGDGDPDDYYGFSLGLGMLIKNRVNLDLAYIYRWGTSVRQDSLGFAMTNADVEQHRIYLSTVIYF